MFNLNKTNFKFNSMNFNLKEIKIIDNKIKIY